MELPPLRKTLENFVFRDKKTSRTLYSGVGNSNLFVREFNFTVAKGLDVKDLNMIMAVITVNENCFPREGLKLYLKYKLATIY